MKPFLLFGIILISISIQAQVTQEWVAFYDGPEADWDTAIDIAVDNAGNVYVTGSSFSPSVGNDYVTVKYNPQGIQQWIAKYSGPGGFNDEPISVAIDDVGNVYVTGTSVAPGTGYDYLTVKYNSSGVEQWVVRYDQGDSEYAVEIALDLSGNVYVTGHGGSVATNYDYVTIKYNSSGVEQWVSIYNGAANLADIPTSMSVDAVGNAYVTGRSRNNVNGSDCTTVKYNSLGVEQWVTRYHVAGTTNNPGEGKAIVLDAEGNVYVTGTSWFTSFNPDCTTIKYNSSGIEQWVAVYNGPGNSTDFGKSINVDTSGNVYVAGYGFGSGTSFDYFTIKYNSEGDSLWVNRYNGPGNGADQVSSSAIDETGSVYVTGQSQSESLESGDYVTIKYNSSGVEQWLEIFNGNGNRNDFAKSIAVDEANNVYVTGVCYTSSTNMDFATIKYSQGLNITEPRAGEKWIAGETDTIRWTGGQQGQLLDLEYTTDNGNSFSIIQLGVLAESLSYEWTIPSNLLSTKIKIRLRDVIDTLISVTSDSFRVKPYIITKVNANGDYIAYDRVTDVWNFGNYPEDMWPMDWYNQFDYQGIDPFTESQYSQWQADFTFASSLNWEHMDWISWVNAFGIDACYYNLTLGIYNPSAVLWWEAIKSNWNGSCFGIAGTNALAFISKDTFREAYPSFPSFFSPITVLADTGVRRVVNELFVHQFGNPSRQAKLNNNRWKTITPNETLNEVKAMLREDSVKIRTLLLFNNNGVGGHNILVYGLEQDETQKELYYLLVYDNSYPTIDNALVLIDTTGNSNQGTWLTTYHWTTWGGPTKLFLDIESSNYLTGAILPNEKEITQAPFILSGNQIDIHSNIDANIQIVDMQGNITGFINDVLYDEIPAASPLIYLNGSETPPYGYSLPADNYSVVLNEFAEDTVETFFFTGNKSFVYERSGATQTQTDRLFFDGGVSAVNPDAQTKTVKILNLINETTQEKLFVARSLELSQNDSVKIENPDSNKVKLISYGTAKEYDLELNYVTENGIGRFGDFSIPLSANSSHTFVPVWTDLTNTELQVLVDFGNDGTIDDTLSLINQITGIGDDQGLLNTPNSFNLAQNYPNPFNPTTKISWQSPVGSHQTLKIYDVLGNEVATLVDEYREAGRYAVEFDASQLSSGIYLYRLQAGSFVQTRKMILLR